MSERNEMLKAGNIKNRLEDDTRNTLNAKKDICRDRIRLESGKHDGNLYKCRCQCDDSEGEWRGGSFLLVFLIRHSTPVVLTDAIAY
ncbi:9588_t:CDS:2 [Paraglomus occultum]|uniref:9588_t:CDS:1 n=1 Tax=Paraglomus occultum TaxID=144539 RepID=A0A9N8ZPS8_9GLOM|nr:9588_t:CDS:2 [Paraglomus occultum]